MNDTIFVVTQLMVMPYIAIASISNKFQRGMLLRILSLVCRSSVNSDAIQWSNPNEIRAHKNCCGKKVRKVEEKVLFFEYYFVECELCVYCH